jgi:hypothetical protein
MSNAHPKDDSAVYVKVRTGAFANLVTSLHYRSVTMSKDWAANGAGRAAVAYRIPNATPGRRVPVTVAVSLNGHTGHCSTIFTPQK